MLYHYQIRNFIVFWEEKYLHFFHFHSKKEKIWLVKLYQKNTSSSNAKKLIINCSIVFWCLYSVLSYCLIIIWNIHLWIMQVHWNHYFFKKTLFGSKSNWIFSNTKNAKVPQNFSMNKFFPCIIITLIISD